MSIQNPDSSLKALISLLKTQACLEPDAIKEAGQCLISESVSNEAKSQFLVEWQQRGEAVDEVATLADFFRDHARNPGLESFSSKAIDIVGTGGDKSGTFNISTTTAIIVAAAGVPVIKHGNRSITSKTGSADLIEALGIPLQAEDSLIQDALNETNFTFLFAPAFHPAFKAIVPVRKELALQGKKTVFNILGPLINPARPAYQLMGVFSESWVTPLAEVLTKVGLKSGIVASSSIESLSMDEITSISKNAIAPVGDMTSEELSALQELISRHSKGTLADLKGGNFEMNLNIFDSVINYQANQTLLNTLCLNAGAALRIANKVDSFESGFEAATDLLKHGKVKEWIKNTAEFYQSNS